ncbi:MAG: GNAT family N-acetyltransferase [Turicibacter sp.]
MYYQKMVGDRCYLSPINPNDYERYTTWVNDLEVGVGLFFTEKVITEQMEKEVLERLMKSEFNFAIIDKASHKVMGNVGMPKVDHIQKTAEVGIFIGDKACWGKGYGKEALELLLDFGFNILNLYNIRLGVYAFNTSAIKCYERIGFKLAGRIRGAKQICGTRYDLIYMDMIAEEFQSIYVKDVLEKKLNNE